ncbi:Metalloendopeptidase OMA1 [Seminavis robusta]|uniref:Metalloendopeptidase OMA1 n=1 Tax=Seminavis robusta TaxID=568900 RepID=A0A9N8E0U7_9STRA|nr:Metalloendopeptidase OMA1 [Seminavis robusta]|eukprot:Sro436_g142580.1 Metalloendopeptidase OMA1 (392) ;mRNA; r:19476-20651
MMSLIQRRCAASVLRQSLGSARTRTASTPISLLPTRWNPLQTNNCSIATQPLNLGRSSHRTFSSGRRMASAPHRPGGPALPAYIWMTAVGTTSMIGYFYYRYLEEVPLTHRKRWIATSPQWEWQLGDQEYQKLLKQFQAKGHVLPPDHRASITVQRVGSRVAKAALKFAQEHDMAHNISKSPYTYTVVRSEMANAFVLPNNHVFVMTGLFKYIQNEDDLAAVLAHECSHNLARHAGERMSSSIVTNFLARLSLLIDPSGAIFTIFLPAAAVFRELPHSRTQETEADQIGVYLAAEACYDPRAAKRVFAAMKKGMENSAPPEFLSTHPSHESRIQHFDQWLPDAMKVYNGESDQDGELSFGGGHDRCHHVRHQMQSARKQAAHQAALREQSN